MLEYEKDLAKITKEIENTETEKEDVNNLLKEKKEKSRLISNEQQLLKEEEQCKKTIEEISKTKVFENGKLVKSKEQLEYESDLIKIQKELEVLQKEKIELKKINEEFQEKVKKYKLKEIKEQTREEKTNEENKKEENTQKEVERFTGDVIDKNGKVISKQEETKKEKEQTREEKIKEESKEEKKKKEEEKKIEEQNIEEGLKWKVKRAENEQSGESAQSTAESAEAIEAKINKAKEEFEKANRDYKNIHLGVVEPKIEREEIEGAIEKAGLTLAKDLKIEIGRTGKITYNGQSYEFGKSFIKEGTHLNVKETIELMKEIGLNQTRKSTEFVKECIKQDFMDPTIIHMIHRLNMPAEDKKKIMRQYVSDVYNAKQEEKFENNCNILYNEEDFSKTNLWDRLMKREINTEEKVKIISKARKANRYNLADIKGEYKPNLLSKLIDIVKREKTPKMPTMKDKQVVASKFNELLNKNEVDNVNSAKYMDNVKLTDIQKEELKELNKAQTSQRNMKEEIHVDVEEILKEEQKKTREDAERFTGDVVDKEGNVISEAEEPQI